MAFIRVKARDADKNALPPSNLVFLIDTSGSMDSYDKLPLLKDAFTLLTDTLNEEDRVSIVTYAGDASVALSGVSGAEKHKLLGAIYNLEAGGSTAGSYGILAAYELAAQHFIPGGNNRIILATDGDFNVGISDAGELEQFISAKRGEGVYLSTLGFGTGNLRDDIMETLAKYGDGNYSYINSLSTANKVLVDELGSNLFVISDDVKAQVEFNPENVKSYRLVGYENRRLADSDFNDDAKDAGEIGVGTDVVMLFELELYGSGTLSGTKYGGNNASEAFAPSGAGDYADELFEVRIRYKRPGESESDLILNPVTFGRIAARGGTDFNFACAAAEFGAQIRNSDYAAYAPLEDVIALAQGSLGRDEGGYRAGFLDLLRQYGYMAGY
jgi:Ca-activated chloride channel family protein